METTEFKFMVGQVVTNEYTGFVGRVVTRCQYLTGCNRYSVQPSGLNEDEGKPFETSSFDEDELVAVEFKGRQEKRDKGGPVANPPSKRPVLK